MPRFEAGHGLPQTLIALLAAVRSATSEMEIFWRERERWLEMREREMSVREVVLIKTRWC